MVIIASYDILIGSPLQILFQFQLSCPEAHQQFPSAIRRSHSAIRCLGASPEVTLRYSKMAGWKIPNRWRFQWECHLKIPMCVNGWFSIPTFDYRTQLGTMKINKTKKVVRCGLICLYPLRFSTACDGTAKSPCFFTLDASGRMTDDFLCAFLASQRPGSCDVSYGCCCSSVAQTIGDAFRHVDTFNTNHFFGMNTQINQQSETIWFNFHDHRDMYQSFGSLCNVLHVLKAGMSMDLE